MKSIFVCIVLSVLFCSASAQKYLTVLPYNMSDAGWYGVVTVGKKISSLYTVNIGLTGHYNYFNLPDRNPNLYLHQRFYAKKVHEFIGVTGNVQRELKLFKSENVKTYVFYELTGRNISAKSFRRVHVRYDSVNTGLYEIVRREYTTINNLWTFDNIVGVGLQARMFKGTYFTTNCGLGTNVIFNVPSFISKSGVVAEYSLKYNVGIIVKFK